MHTLVCPRCAKVVPADAVLGILHRASGPLCGTCRATMQEQELSVEQVQRLHAKHERNVIGATIVFIALMFVVVFVGNALHG